MSTLQDTSPQPSRATTVWVWLAWVITVSTGWGLAWFIGAMASFSSGIYDPDEVEGFQRMGPGGALITSVIMGIVVGLMLGVPLGLYQWLREKRGPRQALITAAIAVVLSVLVCVFSSPGPTQVVGERAVDVSSGFVGGFFGGVWAGGLQYYLLRRSTRGYWVVATIITWAIAWAGLSALQPHEFSIPPLYAPLWMRILVPMCGGTLIGLVQWLFLRRAFQNAAWWIMAWALGWSFSAWLAAITWIGALLAGIVTASVLVMLLRRPREALAEQVLDNPAS